MITYLLRVLIVVAVIVGGTIPVYAVPIALTALDVTVSAVGSPGGAFPATDVTNFFGGGVGTPLSLQPTSVTLLTDSGVPGANQGSLNLATGVFGLNWGVDAKLNVLSGGSIVGRAEVRGVLPETGSFNPSTMIGTSSTGGFVALGMTLSDGDVGVIVPIPTGDIIIRNTNGFFLGPIPNGFEGLFIPTLSPELLFQWPAELGGATLPGTLGGTFQLQVVPEPSTLLLLGSTLAGLGGFTWSRRRRN